MALLDVTRQGGVARGARIVRHHDHGFGSGHTVRSLRGCAGSNYNVVLITLVTPRADHLRCYGYDARGRTLPKGARRLAVVELEVLFSEARFTAGHGQSAV